MRKQCTGRLSGGYQMGRGLFVSANRLISLYLVLVAAAVAGQFFAFPLYAYDAADEVRVVADNVWSVLNFFMAAGLALVMLTANRERRRQDEAPSPDHRSWLGSNVMFYGSVLAAVAFVPNFLGAISGGNESGIVWYLLNTVIPVMFAKEAHRLWRATRV